MKKFLLSVIAVAAVAATGSNAFATGYGSAAGTAYTLGATAGPAYAGSRTAPVVDRLPGEPLITGTIAPRKLVPARQRQH